MNVSAPSGFDLRMDEANHHLQKPVLIGAMQADGQIKVVWKSGTVIRAQPWSTYLPESANKKADWTFPWLCGNCTDGRYKPATLTR